MKTYAQVNKATGYCGAVVSTTGILESSDTVEMILLEEGEVRLGWSWDGSVWTAPPPPEAPDVVDALSRARFE